MNVFIDFSKGKIEKVNPAPIYFGNNNVDKITLYFKNIDSEIEWFPALSASRADGNSIYPRLADANGTGIIIIDSVEYQYYEFTLSQSNGWNLVPGKTLFYVWVSYPDTNGNKCMGTFGCTMLSTSGYYKVDNIVVNPELREYLENSFKQHINEVNTKFEELKEDFNNEYLKEVNDQRNLIKNLVGGEPRYVNTSNNILSLTSNKGVAVATDNGHWYYWDGTQYVDGGVYQATQTIVSYNMLDKNLKLENEKLKLLFKSMDFIEGPNKFDEYFSGYVLKNGTIGTNANTFYFKLFVPYNKKVVATYKSGTIRLFAPFTNVCVEGYLEKGTNEVVNTFTNDFDTSGVFVTFTTLVTYRTDFEVNLIPASSEREEASGKTVYTPFKDEFTTKYPLKLVVKKDGTGDFTTIKDAVELGTLFENTEVVIEEGTYDLIEEFGSSYFEGLNIPDVYYGLVLSNNIKLIFSPNSKVVCNYTGNNQYVMSQFSPFNSGEKGFTIENLNIECSRVRYCVHDERNNKTDLYVNKYKNCNMYIDNTENTYWSSSRCIGGGLGKNGIVEIDNCIFETGKVGELFPVSYHNSGVENAKSLIVAKNCYFKGGTSFAFSYYGVSTKKTVILVSSCSFGRSIYKYQENPNFTNDNIEITEWNNIIR